MEGGGTSTTEKDTLPHAAETPDGAHEPQRAQGWTWWSLLCVVAVCLPVARWLPAVVQSILWVVGQASALGNLLVFLPAALVLVGYAWPLCV